MPETFLPGRESLTESWILLVPGASELEDARQSYEQCLRFYPGHRGAAANLTAIESGIKLSPPRKKL